MKQIIQHLESFITDFTKTVTLWQEGQLFGLVYITATL